MPDFSMRQAGIIGVRAILVPCLAVVELGRVSPPVAPRHGEVSFTEQGALGNSLEEYADIEVVPFSAQIQSEGIAGSGGANVFGVAVIPIFITVGGDLTVAVQILELRVSDADIGRYAL